MALDKHGQIDLREGGSAATIGTEMAISSTLPLPTRMAFNGSYLPRQCGIAPFTTDLCTAIAAEYGSGRLFAIPVNDPDSTYEYPDRVRLKLQHEEQASYES